MPEIHDAEKRRVTLRFSQDDYRALCYWAEKGGYSLSEFIPVLLHRYAAIENGDYQLPTLEQRRLNQLIELITALSQDVHTLENVVTSGFDSLLGLTRGDNYLFEQSDEGV